MNSEDCGMTAAEYIYIAALIAVVSLFRIHCHMAYTVHDRFLLPSVPHLRPLPPAPPPDFRLGQICLLHCPEEILDELEGLQRDCRRGEHRHRLALSHTLPHGPHYPSNLPLIVKQVRISFNLANFVWSPPAICPIRCCILSIDVLLRGLVLALEDGRRDDGLAMEKRERSVRQRFRIGREGRRAVTGSKSKSIYHSIKKATPH